jgi:predicted permease
MGEFWRRLTYFARRKKLQRELHEEMEAHREMMGDERGRMFGSTLKLREEANDAWGFAWWDDLRQDLRYGIRSLRRSPGFTLTAVLVLAFGLGVNLTAFEILNFFVFRPMPVRDPYTIVRLNREAPGSRATNVSYRTYDFYNRHKGSSFAAMMASVHETLTLEGGQPLATRFVSRNYLDELGAMPAYGRLLRADAHEPGAVVLSYRCFERRFGADPSWIGKTVKINKQSALIIGVAPAGFNGLSKQTVDVWAAIEDQPAYFPGSKMLTAFDLHPVHFYGRLAPGVTMTAARDAMRPVAAELRRQSPNDYWEGEWLAVDPGGNRERLNSETLPVLTLAAGLVLLVLLTACANLGNLLLARGAARERELSIRSSTGASRMRLIRQLLTENLLLAVLGAIVGLALSTLILKVLLYYFEPTALFDVTPDWRVLTFTAAAAIVSSLMFGLMPALQTTRRSIHQSGRLRTFLIASQVATSCALVILSGLLVRGLQHGLQIDMGFSFEQSITVDPNLIALGRKGDAARAYTDTLEATVRRLPGVQAASLATISPFGGRTATAIYHSLRIAFNEVDPAYFETLEIPLRRGRTFDAKKDQDTIIVSERLAHKLWPGEEPLGKVFAWPGGKDQWTVIGVAANASIMQLGDAEALEMYRPLKRPEDAILIVRTANAAASLHAIQDAVNRIDSTVVPLVSLVRDRFEIRLRDHKLSTTAITMLGVTAMILAVVGLAGLISFTVTQRTREIGLRMALGATQRQSIWVGIEKLIRPVAVGALLGSAGAWGLGTVMRSQLFGVSPADPLSYATAIFGFALLAAAAASPSLLRASRVDPAIALRHD